MSARSRSRSPIRTRGGIFDEGELRRPGKDGEGGGGGAGRGLSRHSDKMVYISNLPYEMSWMELKDLCRDKAGEVNFVETLEDRNGRSKGSAVVEFKTREGADKCSEEIHRMDIKGRLIVAKKIRDPAAFFRKVKEDTGLDFLGVGDRHGGGGTRDRGGPQGGGGGVGNLGNAGGGMVGNTYGLSTDFLDQLGIKPPLVNRVFIANISYNCGVGRLFDVCSLAGKVTWLDLQLDQDGRSRGMAVVEYSHPIEAVQAVSMLHNQRLYDRTISVKVDRFDKEDTRRREGELPSGLRAVGMGLGANGAPLVNVASVIGGGGAAGPAYQGGGLGVVSHLNGGSAPMMPIASSPFVGGMGPSAMGGGGGVNQTPFMNPIAQMAPPHQQPSAAAAAIQSAFPPQQSGGFFPAGNGSEAGLQTAFPGPMAPVGYPQQQGLPPQQQQLYQAAQDIKPANAGVVAYQGAGGQAMQQQHQQTAPQQQPQQMMAPVRTASTTGAVFTPSTPSSGGSFSGGGGSVGYDSGASAQAATRVILIKNLPHDYTWQIVSDRLQQFGELESVEMISQGVAKVRFIRVQDAERAKNTLQNTTVEGRIIGTEFL